MDIIEDIIFDVPSGVGAGGDGFPTAALIVSFGESNSGGYALNSSATSWELSLRPEVRMWNVNSEVFQDLAIGVNNNLDHYNLNSSTHGWELGLANRARQGYFGSRSVYYLQTGQGASTVGQWNVGGAYWNKFLSRVAGVKSAMSSITYTTHVWITLGINDAIAGTNDSTYKTALQEIISRIKVQLPGCKIYIATLPPVNGTYTTYSTRITEIASEDPTTVRVVSVTSPVTLGMRDANHWSYKGMRRLAARMVDATLGDLSLPGAGFTWSAREDANFVYTTANNQHSHVPTQVDVTNDGFVAFEITADSSALVCILDTDNSEVNWGGSDTYLGAVYTVSGNLYFASANGGASSATATPPCWARFRWSVSNDDLYFETSDDGGVGWTLRNTFSGVLSGLSTAYVKSLSAVGSAVVDAWGGTYQNVPPGPLLLDNYTSAGAAYSTRKLRTAHSGYALRVRRSTDSATLDVGFDGSGNLDTASMLTFVGAGNDGFVSIWYDQSGNSRNLTAASDAGQPKIVAAGSVVTQGTRPALSFDGSDRLQSGDGISTGTAVSVFMVCNSTVDGNSYNLFQLGSPNTLLLSHAAGGAPTNGLSVFPVSGAWSNTGININRHAVAGLAGNGSAFTAFANADTATGTMGTMTGSVNEIAISGQAPGNLEFVGTMQECVVWFIDKRADRSAIMTNMNTYFAVY